MYRLKTIYPYGLKSEFNGIKVKDKKDFCVYSKFNLKNSESKIYKRGCRGGGRGNFKVDVMEVISTFDKVDFGVRDINKIKAKIFGMKNRVIKWFVRNKLGEYVFKNNVIRDIFLDLVKFKIGNYDLKENSLSKNNTQENLVLCFRDRIFDQIKFKNILLESKHLFPLKGNIEVRISNRYEKTLKNLICNYNKYSKDIGLIKQEECYCKKECFKDFIDPFHKHIVTGNLNIVEDVHLREIMSLGSSFRMNYNYSNSKIMDFIEKDLDIFILKVSYKYSWPLEDFREWKFNFLQMFKNEYLFYCSYFKRSYLDKFQFNKEFKKSIDELKKKFIIATVDKANSNFAIICKVFYKRLLMDEYLCNTSFLKLTENPSILKKRILAYDKKLKINRNNFNFPYLFITVKFHKKPTKFRFVTCGTNSYNSRAGKILFNKLNLILKVLSAKDESAIINNNYKVLDYFKHNSDKISSVNTFDFENLFGSIPHELIIEVFGNIYEEFYFILKCEKDYWINLIKFCIFENVLFNGETFFQNKKGIPMGTSFSSAFANIFLYYYEKSLKEITFFRYIDDLIVFNCNHFEIVSKEIYPKELILKRTDTEENISFLDLKIVKNSDEWLIGLYDKRNDFNFKVNCLTNWFSCVSKKVLKNIVYTQLKRLHSICNNENDLKIALDNFKNNLKVNCYPPQVITVGF